MVPPFTIRLAPDPSCGVVTPRDERHFWTGGHERLLGRVGAPGGVPLRRGVQPNQPEFKAVPGNFTAIRSAIDRDPDRAFQRGGRRRRLGRGERILQFLRHR